MKDDHDLFTYPQAAGYTDPDTSRKAAETVDAATLRGKVLATLEQHGAMTSDECAGRMGMSILSIRPRFTELKALGRITDTGIRHRNASGKMAQVCGLPS